MKYPICEGYRKAGNIIDLHDANGVTFATFKLSDLNHWLKTSGELEEPENRYPYKPIAHLTVQEFWSDRWPNHKRLDTLNKYYQIVVDKYESQEREYEEREKFESWLTSSVDHELDNYERNY